MSQRYWEKRLEANWNLKGTGHLSYSERYNAYLYRAKMRALSRALHDHCIDIRNARVLDVGSGIGFWIEWYLKSGSSEVTGLDVSRRATEKLSMRFPQAQFHQADICEPLPVNKQFDIINAFDIFYHITRDDAFCLALSQIAGQLAAPGHLLLTDLLTDRNLSVTGHVRFRSLASYERVFKSKGCVIRAIYPMYGLLNGMLFDRLETMNPKLRRLIRKIEEWTVPLLYKLDGIWIPYKVFNVKLMVVERIG